MKIGKHEWSFFLRSFLYRITFNDRALPVTAISPLMNRAASNCSSLIDVALHLADVWSYFCVCGNYWYHGGSGRQLVLMDTNIVVDFLFHRNHSLFSQFLVLEDYDRHISIAKIGFGPE